MDDTENARLLSGSPSTSAASKSPHAGASPPSMTSQPRSQSQMIPKTPPPTDDDDLPTGVSSEEQLSSLPEVCLSGDKERPLRHVSEDGQVSHYALQPMKYSVVFILVVELLERFSFYGINYTQTAFLTGVYDDDWNAGMAAVEASTFVSVSVAVAYSMPFVGAYLADSLIGDYFSLLFGIVFLYIPGLVIIMLSTIPQFLGTTFNSSALSAGLLLLWPTGTGVVKSVVNVFGAKQFHPLLQSSLIESYYVSFYSCINVGALAGGVLVPIVAQYDITAAYTFPVAVMAVGVILFSLGTPRYVKHAPSNSCGASSKKAPYSSPLPSNGDAISLGTIFFISSLVVPFSIAYSQMSTTFIIQGTVMKKECGFIDAASMNNADAISVLAFGYLVGSKFYPALAERNIQIPTTYKFAIGSGFGVLAIGWALFTEYKIHAAYEETGEKISIMWQSVPYVLIGIGEIFAISSAYEVAFSAAPPDKKAQASAVNLFCVGGLPNILCIGLYNSCKNWFKNAHGTTQISRLEDYASARVDKYFLVLLGISIFGVVVNLLPWVRDFVDSIEDKATEMIKTPVMRKTPPMRRVISDTSLDEESPMMRAKRHQAYLKYGSGPVLYKNGSMRAGQSLSRDKAKAKHLKRKTLSQMYLNKPLKSNGPKVVVGPGGKPLMAGKIIRQGSL